jgi:hypothetical protein
MVVAQAVLVATSATEAAPNAGLLGFLVIVGLGLALLVLYLSLRKQLGRIDFNPEGTSDAERMRRDDTAGGDGDR